MFLTTRGRVFPNHRAGMSGTGPVDAPLIDMRGISKSFGENRVLFDVDFGLRPGEVHALLGENGAGKSTLMKILMGVYQADAGAVTLLGEPIGRSSVHDHLSRGIAMIFQELSLVPNGTVSDNVFLGREPQTLGLWVDRRRMRRETAASIASLGFDLSAQAAIRSLPFAQRQMVEILKAISRGARVLIMDEPTSSLTMREEAALFAVIADLKRRGIGIIYISHRMAEIFAIADRISIVKDGQVIGPLDPKQTTSGQVAALMSRATAPSAGIDPALAAPAAMRPGQPMLQVRGLRTARKLRDVGLEVAAGEVVGIAGLVGSGRSTLLKALFGLLSDCSGQVTVAGAALAAGDNRASIDAGIALVPEDRRLEGLIGKHDLAHNIALPNLDRIRVRPGVPIASRARSNALFERYRQSLAIVATGPRQEAMQLSGGNQQKVVFGKWLATEPRLLLLDEPTSGVDINAKADMRLLIRQVASRGVGVLLVSSELEELVTTADRILILVAGSIVGSAPAGIDEPSLRNLLQAAILAAKTEVTA